MSQQAFTELVALTKTICERMEYLYIKGEDVNDMIHNRNLSPEFAELIDSWNNKLNSMNLSLGHCTVYADIRNLYGTEEFFIVGTLICMFVEWNDKNYEYIYKYIDYQSMEDVSMETHALPMSFLMSYRREMYNRPGVIPEIYFENYTMSNENKYLIFSNKSCSEEEVINIDLSSKLPVFYWHITNDTNIEITQVGKVTLIKGCIDIDYLVALL